MYQQQVLKNCKAMAQAMLDRGYDLVSGWKLFYVLSCMCYMHVIVSAGSCIINEYIIMVFCGFYLLSFLCN